MKGFMLVLLAVVAFASGAGLTELSRRARAAEIEANLNNYFDSLLVNLKQFVVDKGLDPLSIPDQVKEFSAQGLLVLWHGELALTNGALSDLTNLNREGDVIADYQNELLDVKATIGFSELEFTFDYLAEIMDLKLEGIAQGNVKDLKLELEILVNLANFTATLEDFNIEHTGSIHVELHGNGLLDVVADAIIGVVTTLFRDVVMKVVESEVRKVLEQTLSEFKLNDFLEQTQG